MKRRDFLKVNSVTIPSLVSGLGVEAFSHSPFFRALYNNYVETDKVLVLIYLGGGNDGLGTIVPLDIYGQLNEVRSSVIIPENQLLKLDGYDQVAFHPSMVELKNLFNEGKMSVVQNVGYPDQNYSHFRSTDIWMTGADSDEILTSGWLGRYLNLEYPNYPIDYPNEIMPDPLAIQIGYNLSIAFQGPISAMGMVVGDPTWFYNLVAEEIEPLPNTPYRDKLSHIRLVTRQSQVYGQIIKDAAEKVTNQGSYPDNDFAEQLKIVARLIAGGLKTRLYMVSLDGFDTHDSQVVASDHRLGEHADLLTRLSSGVQAFLDDIKGLGISDRVLAMTFSEFGRRIVSNASSGTDHGAAAPLFLFGDAIEPGILGDNPTVPDKVDVEDNLPMQYDFRSVYTTILENWFCMQKNEAGMVMNHEFPALPLLSNSPCISTSVTEANREAGSNLISAYPNPFVNSTNIRFKSNGKPLIVQVFNGSGQRIATLAKGKYTSGTHEIHWDATELIAGNYFIRYQDQKQQQAKWMVKVK